MERANTTGHADDFLPSKATGTAASHADAPSSPEKAPAEDATSMGARAHTVADATTVATPHWNVLNYSGPASPDDLLPPRGHRAHVLRSHLSPDADALLRMPLAQWLKAPDRAAIVRGWRCSVARPVHISELKPFDFSMLDSDPETKQALEGKVFVFNGPVTSLQVDAIVNAANEGCMGGGGVDGAIHDAAGPLLMRECATFNGCLTGHTRITKGYDLPARCVLHTVGPMGERPAELRSCYQTTMELALRHEVRSVGFCCVSTGIFGYPLRSATKIAVATVLPFLVKNAASFDAVIFACFRREEAMTYTSLIPEAAAAAFGNKGS